MTFAARGPEKIRLLVLDLPARGNRQDGCGDFPAEIGSKALSIKAKANRAVSIVWKNVAVAAGSPLESRRDYDHCAPRKRGWWQGQHIVARIRRHVADIFDFGATPPFVIRKW